MPREVAGSHDVEPPESQPSSHVMDKQEGVAPPQDASVQPAAGDAAQMAEEGRASSMLEMWFREAEVIARNLKESGTRR
jgi:hypothetical protein